MNSPEAPPLDLASLADRHPACGKAFRHEYGPATTWRLCHESVAALRDSSGRSVVVTWRPRSNPTTERVVNRVISWARLPDVIHEFADVCLQLNRTVSVADLTEKAAIGVMAVLIHDFEAAVITCVEQAGSGGDYTLSVERERRSVQVEVSGVKDDATGSESKSRLKKKADQVLRENKDGFVSVTAFSHPPDKMAHSYLCFVSRPEGGRKMSSQSKKRSSRSGEYRQKAAEPASEARVALDRGDTSTAKAKHGEAGEILEGGAEATRASADKHLLLFLAATQYYHGGDYGRAVLACRRVQRRLLAPQYMEAFDRLLRDVKARSGPDYASRLRSRLQHLHGRGEYGAVLDVLKEHQYILSAGAMAWMRGECCFSLGDYRTSALFFRDAWRFENRNGNMAALFSSLPLTLQVEGKLKEAWEFTRHILELVPTCAASAIASALSCLEMSKSIDARSPEKLEEQRFRIDTAWAMFMTLPETERKQRQVEDTMEFSLAVDGMLACQFEDRARARTALDRLDQFVPHSDRSRWLRDTVENQSKVENVDLIVRQKIEAMSASRHRTVEWSYNMATAG